MKYDPRFHNLGFWLVLICFASAFGSGVVLSDTTASTKPLARTMHRVQAGVADSAGWFLARSTKGNFSVKLPAVFNDFEVSGIDESGKPQENHTVGTLLPDNTKYSATLMILPSSETKDRFNNFPDNFKKAGTLKDSRKFQVRKHDALEIKVGDKNRSAVMRAIIGNKGLFLLIVEFDTEKEKELGKRIKTFMESFEFPPDEIKK